MVAKLQRDFKSHAVLQGVPFTRVQVSRWKRLLWLHGEKVRRTSTVKLHAPSVPPPEALYDNQHPSLPSGVDKGGHYERGLFTGEISRISKALYDNQHPSLHRDGKRGQYEVVFSLEKSLESLKSLNSLESSI